MIHSHSESRLLLLGILRDLEAADYEIHTESLADHLPRFVGKYRPDAIALGRPKNLAIEVNLEGMPPSPHPTKYGAATRTRVGICGSTTPGRRKRRNRWSLYPCRASMRREVQELSGKGLDQLALLPGRLWTGSCCQGNSKAQTPGRLVEVLAFEGNLLTEADLLRNLAIVSSTGRWMWRSIRPISPVSPKR